MTIEMSQSLDRAVPAHHIETGRVQFGHNEEAPFEPLGIQDRVVRDQRILFLAIAPRQIRDDRRALAEGYLTVLQQRNLLARIQRRELGRLSFPGTWQDRTHFVRQVKLMKRPMRTD